MKSSFRILKGSLKELLLSVEDTYIFFNGDGYGSCYGYGYDEGDGAGYGVCYGSKLDKKSRFGYGYADEDGSGDSVSEEEATLAGMSVVDNEAL